jgi:hypothetical protein
MAETASLKKFQAAPETNNNDLLTIDWVCRRNSSSNGSDVVLKDFNSVQKKDYLIPVGMEQLFTFLLGIPEDLIVYPNVAAIALIEWAVFDHCFLLPSSYFDG